MLSEKILKRINVPDVINKSIAAKGRFEVVYSMDSHAFDDISSLNEFLVDTEVKLLPVLYTIPISDKALIYTQIGFSCPETYKLIYMDVTGRNGTTFHYSWGMDSINAADPDVDVRNFNESKASRRQGGVVEFLKKKIIKIYADAC